MGSDTALRVEFKNPEKMHCPPLVTPPKGGGIGAATPVGILKEFCHFYYFSCFGPFPGHHWVKNRPEMGQKRPVTRKFMIRAPQNMIKCKKIVKKFTAFAAEVLGGLGPEADTLWRHLNKMAAERADGDKVLASVKWNERLACVSSGRWAPHC